MSENDDYLRWCKNIHKGGLTTCSFCCKLITGSTTRLQHYQTCDMAKKFFYEILNDNAKSETFDKTSLISK